MPMLATRVVEYRVFEALGEACGVLVADPLAGQIAFRFRRDWSEFSPPEADVLEAIADDLPEKADEMGVPAFLGWIDAGLSNSFRCGDPQQTLALDLDRTAQRLFSTLVQTRAKPFETHLPVRCAAAATPELRVEPGTERDEWVDIDPGRINANQFLVRVRGRSMEPLIPDGSLCLFHKYSAGSRQNQIVLLRDRGDDIGPGRFWLKRYSSAKRVTEAGWSHAEIGMRSENPEFNEWDLEADPERYETAGIFDRVVADPDFNE